MLPDKVHVLRYCAPRTTDENGCATSASFILQDRDRGYLSINNLDSVTGLIDEKIGFFINYYSNKIRRKKPLQPESSLAELEVEHTKNLVYSKSNDSRKLRFVDKSNASDPTYAGIEGLQLDDSKVNELIAQSVLKNHNPA